MLPVGIIFTHLKEMAIVFGKRLKTRYRHKKVSPLITDFVFNIALFMPFIGIGKHSIEAIMFFKPAKPFGNFSPTIPDYFSDDRFCICLLYTSLRM